MKLRLSALAACALSVIACGPKADVKKPPVVTVQPDAGAAPAVTVSKLPDAKMPPPLELGSPVVERRAHADWSACHASVGAGADPKKAVDDLGKACAASTKLKALGASMSGTGNATSTAQSFPFHADAGRCYRVYAAAAPSIKALVVEVRDAQGRTAAEYHADDVSAAVAPDEALCFREPQDASVVASVGSGDGAFVVQVWSD